MKKVIAIQSNNLKTINPLTDTSLQLAIEAQKRGFKVFWYEADNLSIINSILLYYLGRNVSYCRRTYFTRIE